MGARASVLSGGNWMHGKEFGYGQGERKNIR
uniref:Gag protein n=1 Tax=Human immunodeficiency virus type 1 TaxID=11676 RepID=K0GPH9_HV1|nr:gag protein [Human immunodeficiency virus 1]